MRVDSQYVSNLTAALDAATANQAQISQEISDGRRINALSDDPVAVGSNVLLNAELGVEDTFSQTSDAVDSMLQVSDSALGGVVSQLTQALSLATQANNGTLNASDIQSISSQLGSILNEVVALANTTYLGQYVFSGSQGNTPAYSSTGTYQGDTVVSYLETPSGQKIQLNLPGSQIFSGSGGNVMAALNNLIADYSSGTPSATAAADTTALNTAMTWLSAQRVTLDNSMTRLEAAQTYNGTQSADAEAAQTNLLQTDTAQAATQLSLDESQQSAISQTISIIEKEGTLFNYL
ncbi:flagellar hook-associated protein 3 [Paracidobacterium acidisoli]|uniref:Flagellar hook-associated protein 3 n=1 Tax=Paracidobacterium acidisoli TaxID=2303751 RepID=A0A372IR77_9BACT|nr:flagellar hook-associated protein 3 [Paracidobacterium acidisoli]MBT9330319.1 flagellar hook-associated protein 3 [Paracidobacterium acidisoli]